MHLLNLLRRIQSYSYRSASERRKKSVAELQKAVGKDAGSKLYINEVRDGDKTRYFVGLKEDVGDGYLFLGALTPRFFESIS